MMIHVLILTITVLNLAFAYDPRMAPKPKVKPKSKPKQTTSGSVVKKMINMYKDAANKLLLPNIGHEEEYFAFLKGRRICGSENCPHGDGNFYYYECCSNENKELTCCYALTKLTWGVIAFAVAGCLLITALLLSFCPPACC